MLNDIFQIVVSEQQKYDSGVLRNLGFALLTPFGSILFQGIVFKKDIYEGNLTVGIMVCIIGCIMLYLGREAIKEKK